MSAVWKFHVFEIYWEVVGIGFKLLGCPWNLSKNISNQVFGKLETFTNINNGSSCPIKYFIFINGRHFITTVTYSITYYLWILSGSVGNRATLLKEDKTIKQDKLFVKYFIMQHNYKFWVSFGLSKLKKKKSPPPKKKYYHWGENTLQDMSWVDSCGKESIDRIKGWPWLQQTLVLLKSKFYQDTIWSITQNNDSASVFSY